jgi:DNA polymerase I-like protein with 3'-5' exonuclease and polymerase domains
MTDTILPKYSVFDLETETNTLFKRKASPFNPLNHVVALGYKHQHGEIQSEYYSKDRAGYRFPTIPASSTILVGFNIKFDLLWSWQQVELMTFLKRGGRVWCCQYAEYLLAGQQEYAQMVAMDDIVESYGGELKNDEVKALWQAGVQTSDIPKDLLMDYLAGPNGDIDNTEKIFLGQYKKAKALGMLANIWERMEGLLGTTMMEFNGIYVDKAQGLIDAAELQAKIVELDAKLLEYIPADKPPEIEFKWSNRYHLSPLLFGGQIKYERWQQHKDEVGELMFFSKEEQHYVFANGETGSVEAWHIADDLKFDMSLCERVAIKSGKNAGSYKTKKVKVPDLTKPSGKMTEFFWKLKGYTTPLASWASETEGLYSVAGDIIELLGNRDIPFLRDLGSRAKLNKDLTTYYISVDPKSGEEKGMLTLIDGTGIVHHGLNHNITVTGRLSSSNPNMQNIPRASEEEFSSMIKKLFSSRFGSEGLVLEADYSQLEVYGKGVLSGDAQMLEDLRAKIDFHCKRVSAKEGITYEEALYRCKDEAYEYYKIWKGKRTDAKSFSFQRAFGAGAEGISASTGIPVDDVKKLIEAEEEMYPRVQEFDAEVALAVEQSAWDTGRFETAANGRKFQIKKGEWISPMQTRYVFTSKESLPFQQKRGILTTFMPTEMKNYPTQGESGMFVQGMVGKLFRHFLANDNYGGLAFLINTVHDSVWSDAHKKVAKQVAADMKRIMEGIPAWAMECFDWELAVEFPVDVEVGSNLYEKHSAEHYFN